MASETIKLKISLKNTHTTRLALVENPDAFTWKEFESMVSYRRPCSGLNY
jgi:hypothetical protein